MEVAMSTVGDINWGTSKACADGLHYACPGHLCCCAVPGCSHGPLTGLVGNSGPGWPAPRNLPDLEVELEVHAPDQTGRCKAGCGAYPCEPAKDAAHRRQEILNARRAAGHDDRRY